MAAFSHRGSHNPLHTALQAKCSIQGAFALQLQWHSLVAQRSFSRLRLGYFALGHLQHKQSEARYQHCIMCDKRTRNGYAHALCACTHWDSQRTAYWNLVGIQQPEPKSSAVKTILCTPSNARQYESACAWAKDLESAHDRFWKILLPADLALRASAERCAASRPPASRRSRGPPCHMHSGDFVFTEWRQRSAGFRGCMC